MASFIPTKKEASDFNNGVQYVNQDLAQGIEGDAVQAETINNLVESALYSQNLVESNQSEIEEQFENINAYLNNEINNITQTAENAVDVANSAEEKVDNFIAASDAPPPPVGYHYIQYSGEATPASRWANTSWAIDTNYQGRVIIGSGGSYSLGGTGGSTTHTHDAGTLFAHIKLNIYNQINEELVNTSSWTSTRNRALDSGFDIEGTAAQSDGTRVTGETASGNNIPLYKVVNIWKRTA